MENCHYSAARLTLTIVLFLWPNWLILAEKPAFYRYGLMIRENLRRWTIKHHIAYGAHKQVLCVMNSPLTIGTCRKHKRT